MALPYYIRKSLNTASPGSLANGELAYTANGDVLFIGSNGAVVPIGGKRTPGTLTANQALVANATGYLDVIKTANLYIGSVSVNVINAVSNSTVLGTASNSELTTTWAIKTYVDAKTAGSLTYGNGMGANATNFYVVAGNNQLVSNSTGVWINQTNIDHDSLSNFVSNEHIDHSTVSITAGNGLTGGGTIAASRTLSVSAGTGVTVNSTGVHIGQAVATTSSPTFQDLTLQGNLVINGALTNISATNLTVTDSIIKLANGNATTDSLDVGFYGVYGNSTVTKYTGLYRSASDGKFRLFKESQSEPTTTVNASATGYVQATLVAAIESSAVTITGGSITGITDIVVADGGTGVSAITLNSIPVGNGSGPIGMISGTDGQVLASVSGVPTFVALDGGTFMYQWQ